VKRDRVGRQHEFEKATPQHGQRRPNVAGVEFARREAGEVPPTLAADDSAEQFLFAAEMGVDGRLRYPGLASDCIHADGAVSAGEKGPLGGRQDAFHLAGRRLIALADRLHHACHVCRHNRLTPSSRYLNFSQG